MSHVQLLSSTHSPTSLLYSLSHSGLEALSGVYPSGVHPGQVLLEMRRSPPKITFQMQNIIFYYKRDYQTFPQAAVSCKIFSHLVENKVLCYCKEAQRIIPNFT